MSTPAPWTERGVRAYFQAFADVHAPPRSPLYAALSHGVLADPWLVALACATRPGQPPANTLFAAVQYLLLSQYADDPLGAYFASLTDAPLPPAQAVPAFRAFCETHEGIIRELIGSRVTNTYEVGRCAVIRPGLLVAGSLTGGAPLHLIELGPSAGLLLGFDRYAYHYWSGTAPARDPLGVEIFCELRGPLPPTGPPLTIASRQGLERNPVDIRDPDARLWLRALVWPEQPARALILERALAALADDPPMIIAGDALDLLPAALAAVPGGQAICVFHSMMLYQISEAEQRRLDGVLTAAAARGPVMRLAFETLSAGDAGLELVRYTPGGPQQALPLAVSDPHGAWVRWTGDPDLSPDDY